MADTRADLVDWARDTASVHLTDLEPRWQHVEGVGLLAQAIADAFDGDGDLLVAAAYLHDIGYSRRLSYTGFHPLDGARFLREEGHEELARLVAHHSGARREARLRGIPDLEDEFPFGDCALDRALTYCDLTTSPSGRRIRLHDRIAEIQRRYGAEHVVARSILSGITEFETAVTETEGRLRERGLSLSGSLEYPD